MDIRSYLAMESFCISDTNIFNKLVKNLAFLINGQPWKINSCINNNNVLLVLFIFLAFTNMTTLNAKFMTMEGYFEQLKTLEFIGFSLRICTCVRIIPTSISYQALHVPRWYCSREAPCLLRWPLSLWVVCLSLGQHTNSTCGIVQYWICHQAYTAVYIFRRSDPQTVDWGRMLAPPNNSF